MADLGWFYRLVRVSPEPLDSSSVFETMAAFEEYVAGPFAYAGQIVAVFDGGNEADVYVINKDKTYRKLGGVSNGNGGLEHPAYVGPLVSSYQVPDAAYIAGLPKVANPKQGMKLVAHNSAGDFGMVFAYPYELPPPSSLYDDMAGINVLQGFTSPSPGVHLPDLSPGAEPGTTVQYRYYYLSNYAPFHTSDPTYHNTHTLTIGTW